MALVDGGLVLVVGPGAQITATDAALVTVGLDGVDEDVVGVVVVVLAEPAAHYAVAGNFPGKQDFDDVVQLDAGLLQGVPQHFGLNHVAREAVEQPAVLALGLQGVEHHGDGDGIGHEVASVNVGLGLLAKLGAALDVFAEDGAGFDVGQVVFLFDEFALSTLAAAVGTKNQNIHIPSSPCFVFAAKGV